MNICDYLCEYLSRIAVDKGDPGEVIPISFNALAQYRLAIDHITESFMISHFMVATRSGTSAVGIDLPPFHGAQKGIDPTLKPENQSKSQQKLVKPTPITPGRKVSNPVVRWTPSQTPAKTKLSVVLPGVCLPVKPGSFKQTRVPNSLPMGVNYVDYEPQGTEVIPVYLQTTPKRVAAMADYYTRITHRVL